MRLERHPAVIRDDLPDLYSHIAGDKPRAAERLLDAISDTFAQIAKHPESGMVYPTNNPRLKIVRMLPVKGFPNYLVFFRIDPDAVRILYVIHGARNLRQLFGKQPRS